MPPTLGKRQSATAKIGRAVLRLRLYLGWTQRQLEAASGVDQSTISRLERGVHLGISTRRLALLLDALHVGEILFDRPPTAPQTAVERMIYGDPWARAGAEADRRLAWPNADKRSHEREADPDVGHA